MSNPLTYVNPSAKIASGVIIEPFAVIEKDVEIGEGTWVGPHAIIMQGAKIGKNCKIFPGAVISAIPQDLKFAGEITTVEIGDNTTIRECVTVNRGTKDKYKTVIGKNCLLMAYVHVAHDCVINNNVILANTVQIAGHVVIDNYAIVGGMSAIEQFIHVGCHTIISGGSLVKKDIPPYTKAAREPISYAGINTIGLRRRGFSNDKINLIKEIYRYIYMKDMNTSQALEMIEKEIQVCEEKQEILGFIKNCKRGIMRGYFGEDAEDE